MMGDDNYVVIEFLRQNLISLGVKLNWWKFYPCIWLHQTESLSMKLLSRFQNIKPLKQYRTNNKSATLETFLLLLFSHKHTPEDPKNFLN